MTPDGPGYPCPGNYERRIEKLERAVRSLEITEPWSFEDGGKALKVLLATAKDIAP
jgi:hypothetical protein